MVHSSAGSATANFVNDVFSEVGTLLSQDGSGSSVIAANGGGSGSGALGGAALGWPLDDYASP